MTYDELLSAIETIKKEIAINQGILDNFQAYKNDPAIITGDQEFDLLDPASKKKKIYNRIRSIQAKTEKAKADLDHYENEILKPLLQKKKELGGCKVHAIINAKGGTGKSTIAASLAYTLAHKGYKVLAIDSDSQSSLTQLLNVYSASEEEPVLNLTDIYTEYFEGERKVWHNAKQVVCKPVYEERSLDGDVGTGKLKTEYIPFGFDLIPADIQLAKADIDIARVPNGAYLLYWLVKEIKENEDYDFILIDCPPALTTLAYNAITASTDGVIVPINLSPMVLRSTRYLVGAVQYVQERFPQHLVHKGILGLVKNEYNKNRKITKSLDELVRDFFPIHSFETVIPQRTACADAEWSGRIFAQYPAIIKEGFFDRLCEEIIEEDIRRKDEEKTIIVKKVSIDERMVKKGE